MKGANVGTPTPGDNAQQPPKNHIWPSSDSIKAVGGLLAVAFAVLAVTTIAITTEFLLKSGANGQTLVPVATAAFGVISTVAGAYFGVKVGADTAQKATEQATAGATQATHAAVQGTREASARVAAIEQFIPAERLDEARAAADDAAARTR